MLRDIPTRALLIIGFLAAGLVPLLIVILVSYGASRTELKRQAFAQLESARALKKEGIERYFHERTQEVTVLARDPYLLDALDALCAAYRETGGSAGGRLVGHDRRRFDAPAAYRRVHDQFWPYLSRYVDDLGYYDLLLLDGGSGEICFSVEKERDFATNVAAQPTSLRDVWRQALAGGRAVLSDTRPYPPSANAAAQFVAAPIAGAGGETVGVVALQISIDSIDAIMGERTGMGATGDTYVLGTDGRLRSDSRLEPGRTVEASFRDAVPLRPADLEAVRRASAGQTGAAILEGRERAHTLTAWAPVELGDVRWAIVAAVSEAEIDAQIDRALNRRVLVLLAGATAVAILLALLLSLAIARGIRAATDEVGKLTRAVPAGDLAARADLHAVPRDLRHVVQGVNELCDALGRAREARRSLEDRMQRMQRLEAVGTLAGGIAHDFNNIVTALFAYLDIVGESVPARGAAAAGLHQIEAGLERAADMVRQILAFSRQLNVQPRPLDLAPVVREALALVRGSLAPTIEVRASVPERPLPVLGDATQMHQIVVNLLVNAGQAMGEHGGVLSVELTEATLGGEASAGAPAQGVAALPDGTYVIVRVSDTGCGMDEATAARIFEPFFTTKPVGKGTGMGLAVVHGVVSSAGGAVCVDTRIGLGSTFHVYLPRTAEPLVSVEDEGCPGDGKRILFVDDDAHLCLLVEPMLASLGYRVTAVPSGAEAVQRIRAGIEAFDAVVTDFAMPEVDGLQVAAAVREQDVRVPVILSTAFPERLSFERARAAGVTEMLLKPYRKSTLARMLSRALGRTA